MTDWRNRLIGKLKRLRLPKPKHEIDPAEINLSALNLEISTGRLQVNR